MSSPATTQSISNLSLSDLRETFSLKRDRRDPFFTNWLAEAAPLTNFEQQSLLRLKHNYSNIIETNPLEEVVKLVVVAPLLDLAGFYQYPFSIRAEVSTKLIATDAEQTYVGSIDVLVVKQRLWVLVIESKQSKFDVTAGIPQALSYMLSQPSTEETPDAHRFGMVTNGREVVFLKLSAQQLPVYSQSKVYQVIETDEDLTHILQGLKVIGSEII